MMRLIWVRLRPEIITKARAWCPGGGGGGVLGLMFAGYVPLDVPLASQSPYPVIIFWPITDPILVTFRKM